MYIEIFVTGLFSFVIGVIVGWNGYRKLRFGQKMNTKRIQNPNYAVRGFPYELPISLRRVYIL